MAGFPEVGDVFGRYQITGRLGRGGMGVVFSAMQQGLDRSVALKVLAPELASEAHFRSRFTREATALASLYSPHIIHIYEHGEQDGCLFIATQLVTGGDLWDWLDKNGALPPQQALDVVAQVSWALADAHTAGVIHRDIKPGNVLLHRSGDDDELFAYLCDFGIAQRNNEQHTRTVGVIGTLGYMAPERCEGADANELTDVYALGCLLWAALMGSAPYHGTDVQVAIRHIRDAIPTYSGEDQVSQAINAIIHRSMAKKPEDRYPSASAMRSDLLKAIQLLVSPSPAEGMGRPETADATRPETAEATPRESANPQLVEPLPPTFKYDDPSAGRPVARPPRRTLPIEETPQSPKETHQPRRPPTRVVARLAALAVAVLVAVAVWALTNGSPESRSESDAKPITCWDGEKAANTGACSTPKGEAGLQWVFPSFNGESTLCDERDDTKPDPDVRSWFCRVSEGSDEGVSYTEWPTVRQARANYAAEYLEPATDLFLAGRRAGFRWRLSSPNAQGLFKLSFAYQSWPYSTSAYAVSPESLDQVCKQITLRSPADFDAVSPRCG